MIIKLNHLLTDIKKYKEYNKTNNTFIAQCNMEMNHIHSHILHTTMK